MSANSGWCVARRHQIVFGDLILNSDMRGCVWKGSEVSSHKLPGCFMTTSKLGRIDFIHDLEVVRILHLFNDTAGKRLIRFPGHTDTPLLLCHQSRPKACLLYSWHQAGCCRKPSKNDYH
ncbi:MAG TPA: hypothetical protein VN843_01650, partial [Anaerolineales bacterium]|nr:hypothetical protein [Anaerolineales bacterium]